MKKLICLMMVLCLTMACAPAYAWWGDPVDASEDVGATKDIADKLSKKSTYSYRYQLFS